MRPINDPFLNACFFVKPFENYQFNPLNLVFLSGFFVQTHSSEHGFAQHGGRFRNVDTGGIQGFKLGGSRSLSTRHNGTGVSHTTTGGSGCTGNKSDDGFVGVATVARAKIVPKIMLASFLPRKLTEQEPTTTYYSFSHSAASSSAEPPISPIMIIPSVSGSLVKRSRQSIKFVPLNGSPPIPTHVD